MNPNTLRGWRRWALRAQVALFVLFLAWVMPPVRQAINHLCPMRPDGVAESAAVPSFARQTGMSCEMCHTIFPELTPFGRRFKLNGYTLTTKPADVSDYSVTSDTHTAERNLFLSYVSPISYDVQIAYGNWSKAPPDPNAGNSSGVSPSAATQKDTFLFPEQISIYYAGRVTDNIGAWFQLTYDGTAGSVGIDNTEVRYANHSDDRDWVYGVFINNTPGMQDVYNTPLSAFGIPLFNVPSLYNEGTGTTGGLRGPIMGALATNAVGGGAYAFYDDSLYAEFSGYHSGTPGSIALDNAGITGSGIGSISGEAPYVRVADEQDWGRNSMEVGVMGMQTEFLPPVANVSANGPATANQYLDGGVDWEYQYIGDDNIVTFLGAFTREQETNNNLFVGSEYSNPVDYLSQTSLTARYYYRRRYGATVNFVNTTGTNDALANGTTSTGAIISNGSPDNQYWVAELDYMPWLNTRFILQYDIYTKVDGNQSPFYGTSTKPSDNNTLVLGLWMDF